ncbi:MAG: cupin domain-containing protein [Candidatus Omnitrophica bacterium]|nr:cupin domain-containing protein [Candidatus Omnitrophota bacterium]
MKIQVIKLSKQQLLEKGVFNWPIWEKEISSFDWEYDETEECYFLEGKVTVRTEDGETVNFGQGDFVRFPKGLKCRWTISKPVRKHYNFVKT